MKQIFFLIEKMVSSGARTLDLRAGNSAFFFCVMCDGGTSLNFDYSTSRSACSGKKQELELGGRGKIGGTRLEANDPGTSVIGQVCQ
jgi:hypothetical protein